MNGIGASLLNCLFPPVCAACHQLITAGRTRSVCGACASAIRSISPPLCYYCGRPYPVPEQGHICGDCLLNPPVYSLARAMGRYDPPLRELIHEFKYRGNRTLGKHLGRLMADMAYPDLDVPHCDLVIPVPLHPRRLRERTFNQSLILAREVAERHRLPCHVTVLERHRHTRPQVSLEGKEREKNVRGAFSVRHPSYVKGKRVLLIDDVFTTGHTLNECARVLKKSGAAAVDALTLARVVLPDYAPLDGERREGREAESSLKSYRTSNPFRGG